MTHDEHEPQHIAISYLQCEKLILIDDLAFIWNGELTVKVYDILVGDPGIDAVTERGERTIFTFMEKPDDWSEVIEACFRHYLNTDFRDDR